MPPLRACYCEFRRQSREKNPDKSYVSGLFLEIDQSGKRRADVDPHGVLFEG
jgi:hypothetical protein